MVCCKEGFIWVGLCGWWVWGGFLGYEQDSISYALKPVVGWFVRDNTNLGKANIAWYEELDIIDLSSGGPDSAFFHDGILLNEVPYEITQLKDIDVLILEFVSSINIPDELANVKINRLVLIGEIDKKGAKRIKKMFPKTKVVISGKEDKW